MLRVFAPRNQAYASNSHIFLLWMGGTSLVLIAIALLFLRNQIKPILTLAEAAEQFGKGRPVASFRPRGAREVRQAAQAFVDMRERIERQVEQRTTMLSGVSHDLRTVLTRFKLELAILGDTPSTEALRGDVDEMTRMLEDYLAFAQGDAGETTALVDIPSLLAEIAEAARRDGSHVETAFEGEPRAQVRRARLPPLPRQPRRQCRPPRRPHRVEGAPRRRLAHRHGRRRRPGHPARGARGGVPPVLPARSRRATSMTAAAASASPSRATSP